METTTEPRWNPNATAFLGELIAALREFPDVARLDRLKATLERDYGR